MSLRTYSELRRLSTFEERYDYLRIGGGVGAATFGFDRYINQEFYRSVEWKHARSAVIARDRGLDLGIDGYEIFDGIIIHHMNPMTVNDIQRGGSFIVDPEYLITTTHRTHNAIHYGDASLLWQPFKERRFGDTTLW